MDDIQQPTDSATFAPIPPQPSKAAIVTKLFSRNRGATLAEITEVTLRQPHSTRSFLSGIRKNRELLKETRRTGKTSYRLTNRWLASTSNWPGLRHCHRPIRGS